MAWGTCGAQTQICLTPSLRLLTGAHGLSLPGKQPFCGSLCRNRKLTTSEANSPPGPGGGGCKPGALGLGQPLTFAVTSGCGSVYPVPLGSSRGPHHAVLPYPPKAQL